MYVLLLEVHTALAISLSKSINFMSITRLAAIIVAEGNCG